MSPDFVSRITDIDFKVDKGDTVSLFLQKNLSDFGVVVIPGQNLNPQEFIEAIENFGSIMPQQIKKFTLTELPLVGYNSSNDLPRKNGRLQVRGENYHTDHSNTLAPPKATALHAVQLPSSGGDTQFVDVRRAYEELPDSIKHEINGLFSMHVHQSSSSPRDLTKLTPNELAQIPNQLQPLVIKHPTSGRPALYLNTGRMEGIDGLNKDLSNTLIQYLYTHATQTRYEYRHKWGIGDVVVWDNQAVMHQANADYDPNEYRYLLRLMVSGVRLEPYIL